MPQETRNLDNVELTEGWETVVRFRLIDSEGKHSDNASQQALKNEFWYPYLAATNRYTRSSDDDNEVPTANILEGRIRRYLGEELKSRLISLARVQRDTSMEATRMALAQSIVINSTIRRYSSMDIGVTFEPVKNLIEFFDGNFPYFVTFLQSYVPLAFDDALNTGQDWDADWGSVTSRHSTTVMPSSGLASAFANYDPTGGSESRPRGGISAFDKAKWLWIATNSSLLIPVGAAGFLLWFELTDVHQREERLSGSYQQLLAQQANLIEILVEKHSASRPASSSGVINISVDKDAALKPSSNSKPESTGATTSR
jgi:hypothetical protein